MGKGFLGTPASLMLDVVVCSLLLVVPLLLWSLWLVKIKRNYGLHKVLQIVITVALFIVVALFETDMQMQGGFWAMAKDSPYYNSAFMRDLLAVHLCFSVSTCILWAVTFLTALIKFPKPVGPGTFSPTHKRMAWIAVGDMVATVVTGLMVYYYGFWLAR